MFNIHIRIILICMIIMNAKLFGQWEIVNPPSPHPNLYTTTLFSTSQYLYAGSNYGVFISSDNGDHWEDLNEGWAYAWIRALIVPQNSMGLETIIVGLDSNRIFISSNMGETWIKTHELGPQERYISCFASGSDENEHNYLFAGSNGTFSEGFLFSSDTGKSWTARNNGISLPYIRAVSNSMSVNGKNIIWASDDFTINKSTDFGINWSFSGSIAGCSSFLILDSTIFAGAWYGVYTSTNQGESWFQYDTTSFSTAIIDLVGHNNFNKNKYIFAGTWGQGIFMSKNEGTSWFQINEGLPVNSSVEGLTIDSTNENKTYIFANMQGKLWRRPIDELTNVKDDFSSNLITFYLDQNFPNPFNPNTKIEFSIPKSGIVKLEIFDVLGCKVKELLNQDLSLGSYTVNFDASNLSSGIYYYRLSTKEFIQMKKAVLLK